MDFEKHCPLPVYDEYNGCEYISETTDFFYNRSKEAILKRMILGANEDENIYGLLYKHLLSFEKLFMNYISLELKRVTDNLTNAKIYCDNFTNIYAIKYSEFVDRPLDNNMGEYYGDDYVLNFNYTSIMSAGKKYFEDKSRQWKIVENNVHGRYDLVTVFGMDQKGLNANEPTFKFTKTFRKMMEKKIGNYTLPLREDIEEIIFFGHSLAEADYSYFQSLFDYCDLYGGKAKLIFKYGFYGDLARGLQTANQIDNIMKLLESYGKSMDNKTHGENLKHKLLLENRLRIEEISEIIKKIE